MTKPDPVPLDRPVTIVIGALAEPLTELLGISGLSGASLTLTPATVDDQWYVDNHVVGPGNEAVWWTLSQPDRLQRTRSEIKRVTRELTTMRSDAKAKMGLERQRIRQGNATERRTLVDVLPELAAQVESTEIIIRSLRRTASELELLYVRLRYKYEQPASPEGT